MARDAELHIGVVVAHGSATVTLRGQLDVVSAPGLQKAMRELVDGSRPKRVLVQLGDLAYLDSAGLGVLVGTLRRLRRHHPSGAIEVRGARPGIRKVFTVTGLDSVFELRD
jgi:anti-sigma B factor antagonist